MATTRTDPLTLEVVELIGTVVARYYEEYDRAAAAHSLTGAQARVLGLLSLEPMPMRKIAQKLKCEPSNVTGIVDRLETRGLVERRPDPADRRVKLAAATEKGCAGPRCSSASRSDFAREPLAELSRRGACGAAGPAATDAGRGRGVLGLQTQGLSRVNPWRAHDDSYGTSPRCRNARIRPVRGRPSALRCTASDAAR